MDIDKYGFTLRKEKEDSLGVLFYDKKVKDANVELMVSANSYSLYYKNKDSHEMTMAHRYQVFTQEQLDFLIYNSRIGYLFK